MWKDLIAQYHHYRTTVIKPFVGGLRLNRPFVIDRDAKQHHESLRAANEAIDLAPRSEQDRILGILRSNTERERRKATAWIRHQAREIRPFVDQVRAHVTQTRRDTSLSFPDALDGLDANGMVMLALLRVQMLPLLASMSAQTLLTTYEDAHRRKDSRGYVEAQIIEDLVRSGAPLSTSEGDLPVVKLLREYVDGTEELRLPIDLPDFDDLLVDLDRLDSRADAIGLDPLTDEDAAAAFEDLAPAMSAAGEASDEEDQAALHEEIRQAS